MNQLKLDKLQTTLLETTSQNGHQYRYSLSKNPDPALGEHYLVIERITNAETQSYTHQTFGTIMNFLEMSKKSDAYIGGNPANMRQPLVPRICTASLLDLLYSNSVIAEANILRTVIGIMGDMGYAVSCVNVAGRDDHLEVNIDLYGSKDAYTIYLTINTR